MKRLALGIIIGLLIAVAVWAQVAPTGTLFPAALDDNTTLPAKNPGDTVTSQETNTQNSAIRAIQKALGADPTWTTTSVLDRLALKANKSDLVTLNAVKVLNYTLNAGAYPGSDIGAKVNAALADCNAQVSAFGFCRVTIPPGIHLQTTSISIARSLTELDCQGAVLSQTNGFTDVPIRVNVATVGVEAGTALTNVRVRNCYIHNSNQVAISTQMPNPPGDITDARIGRLLVWKVNNLLLENITVVGAIGHGVEVHQSHGMVRNVDITTMRAPYAGGTSVGAYFAGSGYGTGTAGKPIHVNNLRVTDALTYGVQAVVGTILRDIDVATVDGPCLAIGGAATQGWVRAEGFTLTDCSTEAVFASGAVDDEPAAGNALTDVAIRNGSIRRAEGDGIRFDSASTLNAVTIEGNTIECFGFGVAGKAISMQAASPSYASSLPMRIANNLITQRSGCPAQIGTSYAIYLKPPASNDQSYYRVEGNTLFGSGAVSPEGTGIYVDTTNAANFNNLTIADNWIHYYQWPLYFKVRGTLINTNVRGNTLWGCDGHTVPCGLITVEIEDDGGSGGYHVDYFYVLGNRSAQPIMNSAARSGLLLMTEDSDAYTNRFVYHDNFFDATATSDAEEVNKAGTGGQTLDVIMGLNGTTARSSSDGNPGQIINMASSGVYLPVSGGANRGAVMCLEDDGTIDDCATTDDARRAIGVLAEDATSGQMAAVLTSGVFPNVQCDENDGAINPGDRVVRSTLGGNGEVMADNSATIGVLGMALTACASGEVSVLLGSGY